MIRIGRIAYVNCTPIFHALAAASAEGDYHLVSGVPSALNCLLAEGLIDVCPSSSIEYAVHDNRYLLFPGLSISSIGPVGSVLLFSRLPLEKLDGTDIALSADSATSVNLLKILLAVRYGYRNRFFVSRSSSTTVNPDASATLLIGDSALKAAESSPECFVYDLGKLWHEWTGFPFVFALWFCTRQAAARMPQEIALLKDRLLQAKVDACRNLDVIVDSETELSWMGRERLLDYWRHNISYDLDHKHVAGLKHFYVHAAALGLIARVPRLEFV